MSDIAAKALALGEHMRTLRASQCDEEERIAAEAEAALAAARRVIAFRQLKTVSIELGRPEATISHQYRGVNGAYARFTDVPYLLRHAPDVELANALLAPAGLHAMPIVTMTPEERLSRLEQTLAEHLGPDLRSAIYARAYRK